MRFRVFTVSAKQPKEVIDFNYLACYYTENDCWKFPKTNSNLAKTYLI